MSISPTGILVRTAAVVGAILLPQFGLGAESQPGVVSPIGAPQIANLGGGLLVVILAIVALGLLYARTQRLRSGSSGIINIIATQAIGPKERIAIVEVSDKQLLIGMTTTSVQTLHVFDQPVAVSPAPKQPFADRLKAAMRGIAQ